MFKSSSSLFSFFVSAIIFPFLCAPVCDGQVSVSIWNTQSTAHHDTNGIEIEDENQGFCSHIRDSADPLYLIWFSELSNIFRQNVQSIDQYRIANIYLQKPAIYHCHHFFINLIVETYHDTPELRRALKFWARSVNQVVQRSLTTSQELNIILRSYPLGHQIPRREHQFGIYIMQHQMIVNFLLNQNEINLILRIARQLLINVIQMWKDNERLYIVIAHVQSHVNANILERFQEAIERAIHYPLLLVTQ
ncbi:MAG: hypothetical protein EOP45_15860 [Sphingobacteriaceae bacterium]|nr:MAG: hypothetical protein EOP45_15860 [Sphingobacteriaceae bacterium]